MSTSIIKTEKAVVAGHEIESNGRYIYVNLKDGQIQIKFDDEGIAIDVWNSKGESIASTWGMYTEIKDDQA